MSFSGLVKTNCTLVNGRNPTTCQHTTELVGFVTSAVDMKRSHAAPLWRNYINEIMWFFIEMKQKLSAHKNTWQREPFIQVFIGMCYQCYIYRMEGVKIFGQSKDKTFMSTSTLWPFFSFFLEQKHRNKTTTEGPIILYGKVRKVTPDLTDWSMSFSRFQESLVSTSCEVWDNL